MPTVLDQGKREMRDAKGIITRNGAHIFARAPQLVTHGMEAALPSGWATHETGAATPFAPKTSAGLGGWLQAVTGASSGNAETVYGNNLNWQIDKMTANGGLLSCEARIQIPSTAAVEVFFGLTDATTETNDIRYQLSSTSTFTTSAPTDAAAWFYSATPTSGADFSASGNFFAAVTTKADTDTLTASTVNGDTAAHVFRIDVDSAGNCLFSLDDVEKFTVAAAVTTNVPLTVFCDVVTRTAGAKTLNVDYIGIFGDVSTTLT